MKKVALIIGVTGQDGSFLSDLLIEKGYDVHGFVRRASTFNTERIDHIYLDSLIRDMKQERSLYLHSGDITDSSSIMRVIQEVQPDEIYNLAGQSNTRFSFSTPEYTANVDALGPMRILEAIRILRLQDKTKVYQASTSELFGNATVYPQDETTPFNPNSPHAISKQFGYCITKNYRESYGIFAVNGILFNHESERRGENFVSRKITLSAARIALGKQEKLYLGNLNAERDWGYAKDYVECMWRMLQNNKPEDFVIATGKSHSVRELCTLAFAEAGIELCFEGDGMDEVGYDKHTEKVLVEIDPIYFRPADVNKLVGNPTKAKQMLGWNPDKTPFEKLIQIMVSNDLMLVQTGKK